MEEGGLTAEERVFRMMTLLQGQMLASREEVNRIAALVAQQGNRHRLGAQPPEVGEQPAPAEPAEVPEPERRRNDQYTKILRNAPRFAAAPNQSWRQFELKFGIWRRSSDLDRYANEANKKRALLTCLEGAAMRAIELHGEDTWAWRRSPTLDEYLPLIRNTFAPVAEREMARMAFKNRKQRAGEPPAVYYADKMALYSALDQDQRIDFSVFREEMTNGLTSRYLKSRIIESEAEDDQMLLNDLMKFTAQGQKKFKANCPDVVSLEGLAITTQFAKEQYDENDDEMMEIEKIGEKETRKCYNCNRTGHLASRCRVRPETGNQREWRTCYKCQKVGHLANDCRVKTRSEKEDPKKKRFGGVKTTKGDEEDEDKSSDDEFGDSRFEEIEEIQRIRGERRRSPSRSPERRKKDFRKIVAGRH